jgi:hypothetical protein
MALYLLCREATKAKAWSMLREEDSGAKRHDLDENLFDDVA